MGQFNNVEGMFHGVSYNKFTSKVIRDAMTKKIVAVHHKVDDRRLRVAKLLKEHKITDAMLTDMVVQYMEDQKNRRERMSYSNSLRDPGDGSKPRETAVPAGAIANLVTEKKLIDTELAEVKRLQLITRNLKDKEPAVNASTGKLYQKTCVHTLTDDEIEYLGF